ncbi:MAG: UDP-N-acetylenolpyruvoylglucosamine reductase [Gammaproteobacteria bacterium RIFCSPHIGHO2_12_FULL_41_20]|nr:MAG: UDP-N-acetylenolpyruvoylglucosamine reductase [Gammaproteobacteria bacterium RIFCSPHIGHO2_12_FULL_41_20]
MVYSFSPLLRGQLLPNEPLAQYTSWRVGGPADYVYLPANLADLAVFLRDLPMEMPLMWLGLGSNTLIRDGGLAGVVIVTQGMLHELSVITEGVVRAEAGVSCGQAARYTARQGLAGLEFMAGVPGTVGGALAMNAGCYGGETWQHVYCVETMDRQGQHRIRPVTDFTVGYRHVERPVHEWFVAGQFKLEQGNKEQSLGMIRSLLEKRNAAQPTGTANCGSVFRNPPGNFAACLIEQCGLKGRKIGNACVSEKHANFIINEGDALAVHIESLIAEIAAIVKEKTGVSLVKEVCIVGRH